MHRTPQILCGTTRFVFSHFLVEPPLPAESESAWEGGAGQAQMSGRWGGPERKLPRGESAVWGRGPCAGAEPAGPPEGPSRTKADFPGYGGPERLGAWGRLSQAP